MGGLEAGTLALSAIDERGREPEFEAGRACVERTYTTPTWARAQEGEQAKRSADSRLSGGQGPRRGHGGPLVGGAHRGDTGTDTLPVPLRRRDTSTPTGALQSPLPGPTEAYLAQ